ncbi:PQQ-like beta-propeller repeat protein [bacterium]|nr:PQQ-like beta-propeller repeat protein [bacterium]
MSFRFLPLAAGVLAVAVAAVSAQPPAAPGPNDWPQWRGPNRDGKSKETGLLKSWPKEGPPKLWTVGGLGTGFGTPSVAAGMIFVMGTRDGKDGVFGLTEADGKEVWFTPLDPTKNPNQNNGPGGTPTYHAGKVYAVSNVGTVAALDAKTGKVAWTRSYQKDFGAGVPSWGFNDSPLVDGDKLICAPSGSKGALAALNLKTGDTMWATPVNPIGGGAGYCSPVKMTVGATPTYVCLLGDKSGIVGVHAASGKLLWQYKEQGAIGSVAQIPTPVVYENKVWVSCSYTRPGGAALLELKPTGADKIDVKVLKTYEKPELNNHHGGMILVGKHVYFGHDQNKGFPACVDITTGEIAYKDEKMPPGSGGSVAITFADGRLYYRFQNHLMALVEPDPTGFKMVSSFRLPEPSNKESWPHPVVANGRLLIRDQEKLHCFNVKATTN